MLLKRFWLSCCLSNEIQSTINLLKFGIIETTKLLVIINSLAIGGAEKLIVDALPQFSKHGMKVTLVLLSGKTSPFLVKLEEQKCCEIVKLSNGSVYNPLLVFKLIPHLLKHKLVHVHLFPSLYWVALAKMLSFSSSKLIFTEHNTHNRRRSNLLFKWIDRFIYRRYAKIITISAEVKFFLKKHLRNDEKKFVTIANGVNLAKFIPSNKKQTSAPKSKRKIIIQVAAFTKQKDQETLIKAVPYIKLPVKLLLVGRGPRKKHLAELVLSLGIQDKVSFLGIRTDVSALLEEADLAVLSAHYEGLSLAGLEAMAAGIPLIASDVSGLKKLVEGAGVTFKHKDEIDLADKINILLSDTVRYQSVATSCKERSKDYSLESMVRAHIALYYKLANN